VTSDILRGGRESGEFTEGLQRFRTSREPFRVWPANRKVESSIVGRGSKEGHWVRWGNKGLQGNMIRGWRR